MDPASAAETASLRVAAVEVVPVVVLSRRGEDGESAAPRVLANDVQTEPSSRSANVGPRVSQRRRDPIPVLFSSLLSYTGVGDRLTSTTHLASAATQSPKDRKTRLAAIDIALHEMRFVSYHVCFAAIDSRSSATSSTSPHNEVVKSPCPPDGSYRRILMLWSALTVGSRSMCNSPVGLVM